MTGAFDFEWRCFYVRHAIEAPSNSLVKVEVEPGATLDADVAVATGLPAARRPEDYLGSASFDLDEFEDVFSELEELFSDADGGPAVDPEAKSPPSTEPARR